MVLLQVFYDHDGPLKVLSFSWPTLLILMHACWLIGMITMRTRVRDFPSFRLYIVVFAFPVYSVTLLLQDY